MFDLKNSISEKLGKATFKMAMVFGLLFLGQAVQAAPPETMPIWRAQVRFLTCSVSDAGSDDYVKIELNAGNRTWIESEYDDFAYGSDMSYDLRLEGVNQISNIDYFRIEKTGSDGWCIRRMYLIINGLTIYYRDFGSAGLWLDNSGSSTRVYFIDDYNMRPRYEWLNYAAPARPSTVFAHEIVSRIRAVVGDFVAQDHLSGAQSGLLFSNRGNDFLFAYGSNSWVTDVDLEADGVLFNMNIDANFILRVGCYNGRPNFSVANLNVTSTYDWNATARARGQFSSNLAPRLTEMMKNFYFGSCSTWSFIISPEGNLQFRRIFTGPTGPILMGFGGSGAAENDSPMRLGIIPGDEIKPNEESIFIATVSSDLAEDTEADISFRLPSHITALTPLIEAYGAGEKRQIIASEIVKQSDGSSLITFRDRLLAGQNTEYAIQLMFQPEENKRARIVTCVQSADAEAVKVNAVTAVTVFDFRSNLVTPLATTIQNSADNCSGSK